jgi:cell division septal protein FtsQ
MSRNTKRLVLTLGSLCVLAGVSALAPAAFRHVDAFRVQEVELAGARFLSPDEVVATAGITDSSNVFDDALNWNRALEEHALVAGVRLERRPPHTLRFHVLEATPVALVSVPELVPVDASGRVLPIETAGILLDLPVIGRRARIDADSIVDEVTKTLVAGLVRIQTLDARMAANISEITTAGGGGIRILLDRGDAVEVLLPNEPDARGLLEVRLALDHLESDAPANAEHNDRNDSRSVRIDARYRDELFVTLQPKRTS